ncbi:MAG: PepSY-like domain-containing protein, partial [Paludibacteraceae bacterium]|nr:PepSY-like domain-containing protein [Paludibacteraceae bacterium]
SGLPEKAQQYINEHFADLAVKKILCETDERGVKEYKVYFKNKLFVDFDMVGAWSEINATKIKKSIVITDKMMPAKVRAALNTDFINKPIVKVENDGFEYEFEFADKTEAEINSLGMVTDSDSKK